ncbi:EthD family reductase [Noviherbaspirillum massiliense]|uniref:EthD family reductase n=1 Tax=Noviherbaspirillum massiliense TaxID=1465823 RepID=UPI00037C21A1|nr:EthD family reductase [Noviherbaspirillum massiliense]
MIKVSILYPNQSGVRFDFKYYTEVHMPRSIQLLSAHPGFRSVSVERGAGGAAPDLAPAYIAMCHFQFTTVEAFLEAFMPHASELQGDMPNYTDAEAVIQFNEVLIEQRK